MSQNQKAKIINELIQVLAKNSASFAEVDEILSDLQTELETLAFKQVIQIT